MQKIDLEGKVVLVTGAAGFIGSNLVIELFKTIDDIKIVGIDNMNNYYDVSIKEWRLKEIEKLGGQWTFIKGDISDKNFFRTGILPLRSFQWMEFYIKRISSLMVRHTETEIFR